MAGEHGATAVYSEYCSVCHGDRGDGRSHAVQGLAPPPRDFTSSDAAAFLTREYIVNIIKHGKPGTAMIAWNSQLDDARRQDRDGGGACMGMADTGGAAGVRQERQLLRAPPARQC